VLGALMLVFAMAPVAVWMLSKISTPVFVARYFIPDVFIGCFVIAELTRFVFDRAAAIDCSVVLGRARFVRFLKLACSVVIVAYLALPSRAIFRQLKKGRFEKWADVPARLQLNVRDRGIPMVVENVLTFLVENYYSAPSEQYVFVVDRDSAFDSAAGRGANNAVQVAAALKRNYPELPILTNAELLEQFDKFIVVDETWMPWFRRNIQNHPDFQCDLLPREQHPELKWPITPVLVHQLQARQLSQRPADWRRK
jgi:hypothetical protein